MAKIKIKIKINTIMMCTICWSGILLVWKDIWFGKYLKTENKIKNNNKKESCLSTPGSANKIPVY